MKAAPDTDPAVHDLDAVPDQAIAACFDNARLPEAREQRSEPR